MTVASITFFCSFGFCLCAIMQLTLLQYQAIFKIILFYNYRWMSYLRLQTIFSYNIMGCISQNGCLGPRRRDKEVYMELVDLIYTESEKTEVNEKDIYEAIRQKIGKKGFLRKLLDHLLSHRNKINDCLTYNLRLVSQTRILQRKMASLLVMNEITSNIYKTAKIDLMEQGINTRTSSSQNRLVFQQTQMKLGADLRFDLAYFRLILYLVETQKETISMILKSIMLFCDGRKERIGCKAQVWKTLQLLLQCLRQGIHKQKASQCYLMLLQLIKQGGVQQTSHEGDLLIFLKLWQKQQDNDLNDASEQGFKQTIIKILKLFVNRCMSAWDSKILFRSLFYLYQDEKIAISKLIKLEQIIIQMIQNHDLHTHILRGLFLYLLDYLSTVSVDKTVHRGSLQEMEMQRFQHIFDNNIRLRIFETLRRWGEKGYINLDQSVTFSSSSLVGAYKNNLKGEREFVQQVIRQFFKLTSLLNQRSNMIIANLLLDEIRWQKTEQGVRKLLINIERQLLEKRKLLQSDREDLHNLFIPIDPSFTKQTRIELIQLMGFIIRHLSLDQLNTENDDYNGVFSSITELLYSLYQGPKTLFTPGKSKTRDEDELIGRYQYANSFLSLLKCFVEKYAYLYPLCLFESMNQRLVVNQENPINLYFQMYIIYEGMHQIHQRHKLPDKIMSINYRISPSAKGGELRQEIQAFIKLTFGIKGENTEKVKANIQESLKSLRQFTMIKEQQYKQMQNVFQYYFKPQIGVDHEQVSPQKMLDASRNNQFKRESVNNSFYESQRDHSRYQEESFKDIMERIND